ncbi:MAG: carbamoyltransferase [Gammaproteobacteria bacterium]|nr:carbamoyltransferase [Gammaproteobacteria bacterium]
MRRLLGISAFYHDSAAAVLVDGEIVAAAQEERFTRKKHDPQFPSHAIRYCLSEAGLELAGIDAVVFYDKPMLKFERLLETYLANAPRGLRSFLAAMPVWLGEKLYLKNLLRRELAALSGLKRNALPPLRFTEHHQAHAASAFYASPFDQAAVLCMDGVGEWATTSAWQGKDAELESLWEIQFPHSLGLLYSAFTYHTGFKVNLGEYKLMGLAPYGEPVYADRIREHLIDIKDDGSFRLDMRYFDYATGMRMTNRRFANLFDGPPREPESELTQREMNMARSVQVVTEEIVLKLATALHKEIGAKNLCLAGGVALNCVANGRLLREGPFEQIWVQPAAGDAGGALGAALAAWYLYNPKRRPTRPDAMHNAYLGPSWDDIQLQEFLEKNDITYDSFDEQALTQKTAALLANGSVIGWYQGRMEFGPRALGNRSILGDPRDPAMQKRMNLAIKKRESFRPFAPAVTEERVSEYFELDRASPYMLLVSSIADSKRLPETEQAEGLARLDRPRSVLPAITHVDGSARVQTVSARGNPRFHRLLSDFEKLTGTAVLINTSFNVRGEPIVCTPDDAYGCFMDTEMDYLVLGRHVLDKRKQDSSRSRPARQFDLD